MPDILIVDDSQIDLTRASLLLKKHISDAVIHTARDGAAAIARIDQHPPQIVITDLQMPNKDGLELVVELQKRVPLIPIVLMTAAGSEEIAAEALRKGAASYVPKKQLAVDLVQVVTQLLGAVHEKHNQHKILSSIRSIHLELDNDRNLLTDFAHSFRMLLQEQKLLAENDCFRVTMAVDEALANAYYHGNLEVSSKLREEDSFSFENLAKERLGQQPYAGRKISISISINSQLEIIIRDDGPGFDQATLPDPFDPGFVERASGRGVVLMRSFMDEVDFNERGNQVTMRKLLKVPHES